MDSDFYKQKYITPHFLNVSFSLNTFPNCVDLHPCEVCDRMCTAVGQTRLLMKERFGQFSGLVDDCELGRGEKITTCTDLQGFWDMVFYQVG